MSGRNGRYAVVFDPHPLWLDAVERLLEEIGITVRAKTTSLDRALELVDEHEPDLVVAEVATAGERLDGIGFVREVHERHPETRILVLSTSAQSGEISRVLSAGALAYVVKTAGADDLAFTIRQAFSHSIFVRAEPAMGGDGAERAEERHLTRREAEILRLVAQGYTNPQLAAMLWVTEHTVKFHLTNIYRKLGVRNRTEASHWALRNGLVPNAAPRESLT